MFLSDIHVSRFCADCKENQRDLAAKETWTFASFTQDWKKNCALERMHKFFLFKTLLKTQTSKPASRVTDQKSQEKTIGRKQVFTSERHELDHERPVAILQESCNSQTFLHC